MATTRDQRGITLIDVVVAVVILLVLLVLLAPLWDRPRPYPDIEIRTQLESIAKAVEMYQLTFGAHPGYLSEEEQAANRTVFTSTENLVVSLMGRIETSADAGRERIGQSDYYVELASVGSGPYSTAGQTYGAFYPAKSEELAVIKGDDEPNNIPELIDAKRRLPILYLRASRGATRPASESPAGPDHGAFHLAAVEDYTTAPDLRHPDDPKGWPQERSLIGTGADGVQNLAWITADPKAAGANPNAPGTLVRGGFILIAAGRDQVYFSSDQIDGASAITSSDQLRNFDDVVHAAGAP